MARIPRVSLFLLTTGFAFMAGACQTSSKGAKTKDFGFDIPAQPAGTTAAAFDFTQMAGCSQLAFGGGATFGQMGCYATDGNAVFSHIGATDNNGAVTIGLRAEICAAGLDPASFSGKCFEKSRDGQANTVPDAPAGTTASDIDFTKVPGCSQLAFGGGATFGQMGCYVTDGSQVFSDIGETDNNGAVFLGLRAKICAADLDPANFAGKCFVKSRDGQANAIPPTPEGAIAGKVDFSKVPGCSQMASGGGAIFGQLGCYVTDGTKVFADVGENDNNGGIFLGLRAKVCAAGLDPATFSGRCFTKIPTAPAGTVAEDFDFSRNSSCQSMGFAGGALFGQFGCYVTDGSQLFSRIGKTDNNGAVALGLRMKVCAAGLDPANFTGKCFHK